VKPHENGGNLAAIDIGTNSFHLVVVHPVRNGKFIILESGKEAVRLGSGVGTFDVITDDAMERAISALLRFKKIADSFHAPVRAVATSAVREAVNRDLFLARVKKEIGLNVDVISGHEEARLIYLGILQAMPVFEKPTLAIDIGGGSTEFVFGNNGNPLYTSSLKIGAIRLTDQFFHKEPITQQQIEACRKYIRISLSSVIRETKQFSFEIAVGSSGTIETLLDILNGSLPPKKKRYETLSKSNLERTIKILLSEDKAKKRARIPGLDEKRADIIIGGALLLQEVFKAFKISELHISPYALREGIIFDSFERSLHHSDDIRKNSVLHLADHFFNPAIPGCGPANHIAFLSLQIFDELMRHDRLKKLQEEDRKLLEYAALLHNIGLSISHSAHHRHSAYIIRNTEHLIGFTWAEIEIMALLTRYHRKGGPSRKHPDYMALRESQRHRVNLLAAILRIATALDRTGRSIVESITLEIDSGQTVFKLFSSQKSDPSIEIWSAEMKADLFEKVFQSRAIFMPVHSR